jgi:predicted phosphoribosyltransferase
MRYVSRSNGSRTASVREISALRASPRSLCWVAARGSAGAFEVALHAPLDVFVVRKLGTPGRCELAMAPPPPEVFGC